jgi:hypothetical protein
VEDGASGATSGDTEAALAASNSGGSSDGGANGSPGGVLGAGASGEGVSQPSIADGGLLGGGDSASSMLVGAVLALIGLGLLVGIAGGLRALHGRHGFP